MSVRAEWNINHPEVVRATRGRKEIPRDWREYTDVEKAYPRRRGQPEDEGVRVSKTYPR